LRLEFYHHTTTFASGNYLEIAQVQLELGSVATDFEHRSYGEELALCQRYYWQGKLSDSFGRRYGTANGGYLDAGNASFPVTMRGTSNPDAAIVTDPTYDGCTFYSAAVNVHGLNLRINKNTNSGLYRAYNGVFSADAEL